MPRVEAVIPLVRAPDDPGLDREAEAAAAQSRPEGWARLRALFR
jgi:hypothetical protein